MREWDLLQAIYRARPSATRAFLKTPPPIQTIQDEFGESFLQMLGPFMYITANYNPETLSGAHYTQRNCYESAENIDQLLGQLASLGLLEPTGNGNDYRVTEKGWAAVRRVDELVRPRWRLTPVEGEALDRALELLSNVVEATKGDMPCETWSVQTRANYGWKPPTEAPPLQRLDVTIFDLWAYRDDSHLAAWRPQYPDLDPRAWEAVTYLWRGEAKDAASLAEALQEHHYPVEDYAAALDELAAGGWVEAEDGVYKLTYSGEMIRENSEALTDQYFYMAFDVLSESERDELRTALQIVLDNMTALAAG